MKITEPQVFLIAETRLLEDALKAYLQAIGAEDWQSEAPSDIERLIEVMGRLCYRSFKPGLNPNVTKVRPDNKSYLENILRSKHGSVLEHGWVSFIFLNVSRVFTHELVRHRAGTAISQESLRFVRVEEINFWPPISIKEDEKAMKIFYHTVKEVEKAEKELIQHFDLDNPEKKFAEKKKITSALRRILPIGLSTSIGWSCNMRTLRWVLEMRTDPAAEEEIRYVFAKVGEIVVKKYPHLFQDFEAEIIDGIKWWKPKYSKV